MKKSKPDSVTVFDTVDLLNHAAAQLIVDTAEKTIAQRRCFTFCLSGGNTPKQLYSLLSTKPYRDKIPWKQTFIFWSDERCVPIDDERNNAHMAMETLLSKVAIPSANIFRMPVQLAPKEAAKKYEETLHTFFGTQEPSFDLMLLGLGDNGHTASLFPNTDVLNEKEKWVKEVYIKEQNEYRITMTATLINKAYLILFLVTGKEKANMLSTILTAPYTPERYPAQLIKPVDGELFWFVDKQAGYE